MPLAEIPLAVRDWIDFRVAIHVGGGLGDVAHHFKANPYFRIARDLKRHFPRLSLVVQIESRLPHLIRGIFENEPWCDDIVTATHRPNDWTWKDVDEFLRGTCEMTPEMLGARLTQFDPEIVFRRVVNRICALARFPRVRAITIDDFFQQMDLEPDEFEYELAQVRTTRADEVEAGRILSNAGVGDRPLVMLHAVTADESRRIYSDSEWRALAGRIAARGNAPVIFGGPEDDKLFNRIFGKEGVVRACFDGRLGVKIALLKRCRGVVCIDGGLMSLAWLHAVPTVVLMSPEAERAGHNQTVTGYHWARAAREPFAGWHVIDRDRPETADPNAIVDKVVALSHTKGRREADVWRDQCPMR